MIRFANTVHSLALNKLPSHMVPDHPPTSSIPFFHMLERLKTTDRQGWIERNISHPESISDHMYRMSIITMLAPSSLSSRLNISRCIQLALVHDMAESLVGDITPSQKIAKVEKSRRERESISYLTSTLLGGVGNGGKEAGDNIYALWLEYEDNKTLEAQFVHDVDKLELMLQMVEYERADKGGPILGSFTDCVKNIVLPEVKEWCAEVLRERESYWREKGMEEQNLAIGREFIESWEREQSSQRAKPKS